MLKKHIVIIGAGPAGLYAALLLLQHNFMVTLVDKNSGAGKKFLIAGHSGLNVTHSEDLPEFLKNYSPYPSIVTQAIEEFPPSKIKEFYQKILKTELFSGSTGHVFPVEMKGGKVLLNWLELLKESADFKFLKRTQLETIKDSNSITIKSAEQHETLTADYFIYALGGASWKKTGSAGDWNDLFEQHNIKIEAFHPENCGHEVLWSKYFSEKVNATPLKNIAITTDHATHRGEILITPYGVEGQLIYKLSRLFSSLYKKGNKPVIHIDLLPDLSVDQIKERLLKIDGKASHSTKLKKGFKFSKGEVLLINEFKNEVDFNDSQALSQRLKSLKLTLEAPRPIDEAISTSGGIALDSVSDNFELINLKNHFCVGEMLDWSAPTGGYLLSACLSTAHSAATEIIKRN